MRAKWSTLPHQLRTSGITLLLSWTTVLAWSGLTDDFAEVSAPLLFIGLVVVGFGAVSRWGRLPAWVIIGSQIVIGSLLVLSTTTGSLIPSPANVDALVVALQDAVTTAQAFAAPIQSGVPSVHPLLLGGGAIIVILVDVITCTWRKAPIAGLVLLASYTIPVAVTGNGVSWWLFMAISALFLALLYIQHADHVAHWGRVPDAGNSSASIETGAIGNTAIALGSVAIVLAVIVPAAVPTMSVALFEGNGRGSREVRVNDPMVDLRRDLSRGEDVPLLRVTTSGPKPSYLRVSVLTTFTGSRWTPGDREIPESQTATGEMPPLDGVSLSVPREEFDYNVVVGSDFESTWLPTTSQVTRIEAGPGWRYDVGTRDFIAAKDDVSTADTEYDFSGVQLSYDAPSMNTAVSGANSVSRVFTEIPPSLNNDIRRLAASVTADAPTRFQKAQALQQWFRVDGDFRYDLGQVESAGSGDADLVAFLKDRVGYCEQFAASMALMARVLGIPSRVAVGFLEPEPIGDVPKQRSPDGTSDVVWEFSAHDFHAWPELYFPGSGWVRFEPTPPDRAGNTPGYTDAQFAPAPEPSAPSPTRSTELLPERGQQPDPGASVPVQDDSTIPWARLGLGAVGLLLVTALLLAPRLLRRARRRRRLGGDIEDVWEELRAVTLDLGRIWPAGRSPRRAGEWLGHLLAYPGHSDGHTDRPRQGRAQAPEAAESLDRLVLALEQSRYSRAPEMFTADQFHADAARVESALSAGVSGRTRRRAAWWPASVLGRSVLRRRARRTPTGAIDHESAYTVDEMVG